MTCNEWGRQLFQGLNRKKRHLEQLKNKASNYSMATKEYISDSESGDYNMERKWIDNLKEMELKVNNIM